MSELESIEKLLKDAFQDQKNAPNSSKRSLDFNIWITSSSLPYLKPNDLIDILAKCKNRFESVYGVNFNYKFFIAPDVEPATEMVKRKLRKEQELNHKEEVSLLENEINVYNSQHKLFRELVDYIYFFKYDDKPTKNQGLNCIISGLSGRINLFSDKKILGTAIKSMPYLLISLANEKKRIEKTLQHEISHCFGAKDSYFPLSLMYPNQYLASKYWNPFSKHAVRKGIEKYLNELTNSRSNRSLPQKSKE